MSPQILETHGYIFLLIEYIMKTKIGGWVAQDADQTHPPSSIGFIFFILDLCQKSIYCTCVGLFLDFLFCPIILRIYSFISITLS